MVVPNDELSDLDALGLSHDKHKRAQKVVLKGEVGQLVTLQKLHAELAQAVHGVHGNLEVFVAADFDEKVSQQRPDAAPYDPEKQGGLHGLRFHNM